MKTSQSLPRLSALTGAQFCFSVLSLIVATALVSVASWRIYAGIDVWSWWVPVAFLCGMAAADLGSGLVHWAADTWGRDDTPLIGARVLVPFRVHHVNPDDFLRRSFVDTNGDVAFLTLPPLLALLNAPFGAEWAGPLSVFGLALCLTGGLTNQIHQWAHQPKPPRIVRWLQTAGIILGRHAHAVHHERPYDCHYCITTGWWNRPLEALGFFRRLEALITGLTGVKPRHNDRDYDAHYLAS